MSKIKEYRLKARWSQNELARQAKVDERTVRRAEEGQKIQDVKAAQITDALAQALGITLTMEELEITLYP